MPLIEVERRDSFDFLSAEYFDLFSRSTATAFQHPLWLQNVCTGLVEPSGARPFIITGRRRHDGRLLFVIPMMRRRYAGFTLVDAPDLGVSDYNCVVIDRDFAAALPVDETVRAQVQAAIGGLTLARMRKVRADALAEAKLLGRAYNPMNFHAHQMRLQVPAADWRLRSYDPHFRRYLEGKTKRLSKKGLIRLEELEDRTRIRHAFELMRSFRKGRWKTDLLNDRIYFEFYVNIASTGCASKLSRTYLLSVGEKPVAALFGLAHDKRFMFLLLGFTPEDFRNHSLGLILLDRTIEDCIGRGDTIFDLTIGDEMYKRDFASETIPIVTVWGGNGLMARLAHVAMALKRRLSPRPRPAPARGERTFAQA